jgi:hypothetical protein
MNRPLSGVSNGGCLQDCQGAYSQEKELEELPFAIYSFPWKSRNVRSQIE